MAILFIIHGFLVAVAPEAGYKKNDAEPNLFSLPRPSEAHTQNRKAPRQWTETVLILCIFAYEIGRFGNEIQNVKANIIHLLLIKCFWGKGKFPKLVSRSYIKQKSPIDSRGSAFEKIKKYREKGMFRRPLKPQKMGAGFFMPKINQKSMQQKILFNNEKPAEAGRVFSGLQSSKHILLSDFGLAS